MPPVQQDQISPVYTLTNFENINTTPAKKILHNGTDILKLSTSGTITYFGTDGVEKTSYSLPRSNVLDIEYSTVTSGYYLASLGTDTLSGVVATRAPVYNTTVTTGTVIPYSPNEDFSTGSGTSFNTSRWEDLGVYLNPNQTDPYKSFRRQVAQQNLMFNLVNTGGDRLKLTTRLSGTLDISLNYNITTITGANNTSFGMSLALPTQEIFGVGIMPVSGSPSSSTKFYTYKVYGINNLSDSAYLTNVSVPHVRNLPTTDTAFKLSYSGIQAGNYVWSVISGSIPITSFTVDSTTKHCHYKIDANHNLLSPCPISFDMYNPAPPHQDDFIDFNTYVQSGALIGSNSGTLRIQRDSLPTPLFKFINDSTSMTDPGGTFANLYLEGSLYRGSLQDQINIVLDNLVVNSGYNSNTYEEVKTVNTIETTVSSINLKHFYTAIDQLNGDGSIKKTLYDKLLIGSSGDMLNTSTTSTETTSGMYYDYSVNSVVITEPLSSGYTTASSVPAFSGNFGLTYNPYNSLLYMACFDSVKMIPVPTGTTITGYTNETFIGSGITSVTGILQNRPYYSFNYNNTRTGFISYVNYDSMVSSLKLQTITKDNPPVSSENKLFLDIPDWSERVTAGAPYQIFCHGNDHNTLFYLRKNGINLLNSIKITSSGSVTSGSAILTDTSISFPYTSAKKGDVVIINKSGFAANGTYTIAGFAGTTGNPPILDRAIGNVSTTLVPYTITSNAELMKFNADASMTAFAAVNASDYNIRAGATPEDTSVITAQVINAWGDPLGNKNVHFQVNTGAGWVIDNDVTTKTGLGMGEASTTYVAGTTAGPVQIQVTVSD